MDIFMDTSVAPISWDMLVNISLNTKTFTQLSVLLVEFQLTYLLYWLFYR